jgi:hypothetical protein
MLTGRVTYRHEDRLYELNPGDAPFFNANGLHGPEILTMLPMTHLSIIVYPRPWLPALHAWPRVHLFRTAEEVYGRWLDIQRDTALPLRELAAVLVPMLHLEFHIGADEV